MFILPQINNVGFEYIVQKITLNKLGNISSIVGLFITICIFFAVKRIKNYYIFKARVPQLREKLQKHASNIIDLLKDYSNNKKDIILELARTTVTLNSLIKKPKIRNSNSVKTALGLIKSFRKKVKKNRKAETESQEVYEIYTEMQIAIDEILELEKDIKWER